MLKEVQEWFSISQAAELLGVSRQALWSRIRRAEEKRDANCYCDLKRGRDYRSYLGRWQLNRATIIDMLGLCNTLREEDR